jgi:hypothetical protein
MQYKASYKPSFLLCPEVYTLHPVSECKTRLDRSKYCRFNDDPSAKDKDGEIVLNEVRTKIIQDIYITEHWQPTVSKTDFCLKEFIEHTWDLKFSHL